MSDSAPPRVFRLDDLPLDIVTPLFSKKTISGDKLMIVWSTTKRGEHAAAHSHAAEQIFWVTTGCMRMRVADHHFSCPAGSVVTIPSWVEHEGWIDEDTTFVSFLSEVREDLQGGMVPEHFKS